MNAMQLIEALKEMPPEAEVYHLWDGAPRTAIQHVYLARDGYIVTADYGMLCHETGARPDGAPTYEEDWRWKTPKGPGGA